MIYFTFHLQILTFVICHGFRFWFAKSKKKKQKLTKETIIDEQSNLISHGVNRCRNECGRMNIYDGVNGNSVAANGCLGFEPSLLFTFDCSVLFVREDPLWLPLPSMFRYFSFSPLDSNLYLRHSVLKWNMGGRRDNDCIDASFMDVWKSIGLCLSFTLFRSTVLDQLFWLDLLREERSVF